MIRLSKELLLLSVKQILKKLNWKTDYLWTWLPYDVHLIGRLGEKKSIYRTFDEVGEWMSSKEIKHIIEELDIKMCHKVDYVLCSAKSQYDKRRHLNPATHFVPFGVNFKHFNHTLISRPVKPNDWPVNNNGGVIGYVGTIDWRFDFDLMEKLVKANKNLNFVLLGPYRNYGLNTLENLCRLDNVFWLGEKPFEILPSYVTYFDVGIIPYKVGPDTNTMRIYKVFEYLSAGKPVVSTNLYEIRQMGNVINIANDFEEFQDMIYKSISSLNDPDAIKQRVTLSSKLDWDNIYKQFAEIINF
jgi:glycosyltransferase involved in cell wall biosynthesis